MPILKLENISKSFGAINALNDVSLSINPGEVLGLMGDNGAGKSTLIKIIAGNFKPTSGSLIFNEQKVEFAKICLFRRITDIFYIAISPSLCRWYC